MNDNKKVAVVGAGLVGMSCAYALLNQNACDELVLVDIDSVRAAGEAMDLNHSLAFSPAEMRIYGGSYSDCADADVMVIAAGVNQKIGEKRTELLKRNAAVFESIVIPAVREGFSGIFLVATNPVDIMTRVTRRLSGFEPGRVIGTGTSLDSARLRYLLGHHFDISPKNIHAYVIGEHGDSEIIPWSQAVVGTKPVLSICEKRDELIKIENNVKYAAQEIIKAKNATYYGIGMALVRIIKAILGNENSIITVSALLSSQGDDDDIFVGLPCVINRNGVREQVELRLSEEENKVFAQSCEFLKQTAEEVI